MTDVEDQGSNEIEETSEAEEQPPEDSFVDILTGEVVKSTQKRHCQLIACAHDFQVGRCTTTVVAPFMLRWGGL